MITDKTMAGGILWVMLRMPGIHALPNSGSVSSVYPGTTNVWIVRMSVGLLERVRRGELTGIVVGEYRLADVRGC